MKDFVFKNTALEYSRAKLTEIVIPISFASGVPSVASIPAPDTLIEKGLAGSQVILTQAKVDTLLGTASDLNCTLFLESTSMAANDTFALVIDCDDQIEAIGTCEIQFSTDNAATGAKGYYATYGSTAVASGAFTGLQVNKTTAGNIAVRCQETDCTASGTDGYAVLKMEVKLK